MNFKIEYTNKDITPYGGMSLMNKLLITSNLKDYLSKCHLPTQGSNRGYKPEQLIVNFWLGVWSGANNYSNLDITRQDVVISNIFDWHIMAEHKAFQRYFDKFTQATNQDVFTSLYNWFFSNLNFDNYALDLDSTVITRYGEQQGAAKGYNPKKRGRKSHHPLIAFVPDCRMIANFWLRPGNTNDMNNFLSFLEDTVSNKLKGKRVGLIRADSGFYSKEIFDYLENNHNGSYNYIIAARFHQRIKWKISDQKTWLKLDDGIDIAETTYQADDWEYPRRIVMVRQEINIRPKASGKQLKLFEEEGIYKNYRYSCFITNMNLPAKAIYDLYRKRADSENRIKEIKYDFGAESFVVKNFWATEAVLNFSMMAYNIMSLFRQAILRTKSQPFLKTIRHQVFAIAAYFDEKQNTKVLKLSLSIKRSKMFDALWKNTEKFSWNFNPT